MNKTICAALALMLLSGCLPTAEAPADDTESTTNEPIQYEMEKIELQVGE